MFITVTESYEKLKLENLDNIKRFEKSNTRGKETVIVYIDNSYSYCSETIEQINKLIDEKSKQSV